MKELLIVLIALYFLGSIPQVEMNKRWMTNANLQNKAWPQIKVPGTHNSGTYGLSRDYSIDTQYDQTMAIMPLLAQTFSMYGVNSSLIKDVMIPWMTCQKNSIYRQLKDGIRHFDFRLCQQGAEYHLCHGFIGPRMRDVLSQIRSFLLNNPNEKVLLDFNHVYGVTNHSDVTRNILEVLGDMIIPRGNINVPLGLLSGKVFVFYSGNQNDFDNSNLLNTLWANKQNMQDLINYQVTTQNSRNDPSKVFVSQFLMTPSLDMIASGLVQNKKAKSVKDLAKKYYWQIPSVISSMYNSSLVNTVSTDFYTDAFVSSIISMN